MNNNKTRTIIVTGGHITPALALIDELKKVYRTANIILIGRNFLEARFAREKKIDYLPSFAGRSSSIWKTPFGFIQAIYYCIRYRPDIVVSFGGYVALPVAISAYILRIPVITHEQTRVVGAANKIIGIIARKICVTFEDQLALFSKNKTVVTGLPLRRELFDPPKDPSFTVDHQLPILYITGGSMGAVSLNDMLFPIIDTLTKTYTVIHQTGALSVMKAMHIHEDIRHPDHYIVKSYFDIHDVAWILHNTTFIIGRSGANTVMEAAVLGKNMICIPLPWSAGGEQMANAKWLEKRGLAFILPQKEVTLDKIIGNIQKKPSTNKKLTDLPNDGAKRLLFEVNVILEK